METQSNSAVAEAPTKAPKKVKASKAKPTASPNTRAMQIIAGAAALKSAFEQEKVQLAGFEYRAVEKVKGMHVVRIPTFKEAVKKLPKSEQGKAALDLIRALSEAVASFTGGDASAT